MRNFMQIVGSVLWLWLYVAVNVNLKWRSRVWRSLRYFKGYYIIIIVVVVINDMLHSGATPPLPWCQSIAWIKEGTWRLSSWQPRVTKHTLLLFGALPFPQICPAVMVLACLQAVCNLMFSEWSAFTIRVHLCLGRPKGLFKLRSRLEIEAQSTLA